MDVGYKLMTAGGWTAPAGLNFPGATDVTAMTMSMLMTPQSSDDVCEFANEVPVFVSSQRSSDRDEWAVGQRHPYEDFYIAAKSNPSRQAFVFQEDLKSTNLAQVEVAADVVWKTANKAFRFYDSAFPLSNKLVNIELALLLWHAMDLAEDHQSNPKLSGKSRSNAKCAPIINRVAGAHLSELVDSVISRSDTAGAEPEIEDSHEDHYITNLVLLLSLCAHSPYMELYGRQHPEAMQKLAHRLARVLSNLEPPTKDHDKKPAIRFFLSIAQLLLTAMAFGCQEVIPFDFLKNADALVLYHKLQDLGDDNAIIVMLRGALFIKERVVPSVDSTTPPPFNCAEAWEGDACYAVGHGLVCDFESCQRNVRNTTRGPMMRCSKCLSVVYCGAEHQRLAWKGHKLGCVGQAKH